MATKVVGYNTANHSYQIQLDYTAQDVGKVFYYVLVEETGNIPGMTYDQTTYHITVAVRDNNQGGIETYTIVENASLDGLNFINVYAASSTDLTIEGEKNLTGRDLVEGEFKFLAYQVTDFAAELTGQALVTTHDAQGNFVFTVEATEAGTYRFVVLEDTSAAARLVTFDRTVYWVTVEVTDDGNGQLIAGDPVVTLADSTEAASGIVFNNAYNPNVPQTGDNTNLTLWVSLMVFSLAAAAALLLFEAKRKQAKG